MAKANLKSVDSGINTETSNVVALDNATRRELNLSNIRAKATEYGLLEGNGTSARLNLCKDFADRLAAGTARLEDVGMAWNVFATTRNAAETKKAALPVGGRKADTYLTKMRSHCQPSVIAGGKAWRDRVDAMISLAGKESLGPYEAHYQANIMLAAFVKLNRIAPEDFQHAALSMVDDDTIFEAVAKESKATAINAEFVAIGDKITKLLSPGEKGVDHIARCEDAAGVQWGDYRAQVAKLEAAWLELSAKIADDITAKRDRDLTAAGK